MPPSASGSVAAFTSTSTPRSRGGFAHLVLHSPARDWVLVFLAAQCLVNIDGFVNPYARWASMVALVEEGTFRIDSYHQHTMDWARTPDGHYHSNKAPGPVMVALPLFWALDRVVIAGADTRVQRDGRRIAARVRVLHVLSIVTQAIPYAAITVVFIALLQQLAVPLAALHLTAVALLFGNTAALFMNTFFGHGLTAVCVLIAVLALCRRWPARLGLFLGVAVLCDYGAALLVLPTIVVVARQSWFTRRTWGRALLGAAGPAVVFAAYHGYYFGGPFALPNQFQNPVFVDATARTATLWGVFAFLPDPQAVVLLLFGSERGVAFTQGWVLLCLVAIVMTLRRPETVADELQRALLRPIALLAIVGFLLLLTMNACFLAWHGGETPGPRYLSAIFPVVAVTVGIVYPTLPPFVRVLFGGSLALSVALFALVFGTASVLPQGGPLFVYYWHLLAASSTAVWARTLTIGVALGCAAVRARNACRREAPRP